MTAFFALSVNNWNQFARGPNEHPNPHESRREAGGSSVLCMYTHTCESIHIHVCKHVCAFVQAQLWQVVAVKTVVRHTYNSFDCHKSFDCQQELFYFIFEYKKNIFMSWFLNESFALWSDRSYYRSLNHRQSAVNKVLWKFLGVRRTQLVRRYIKVYPIIMQDHPVFRARVPPFS